MYVPRTNREDRPEVLAAYMQAHPFATLVSAGPDGEPWATHLPVVVHPDRGPHGTIEGHLARANRHHEIVRAAAAGPASAARGLVIFTGPEAYVTPSWYPAKAEHGRVVPTWNYVAVHATGNVTLRDEPEWLLEHVGRLTDSRETARPDPWRVTDAPAEFIATQLRAIVGFELHIDRLEGRWKMSQNLSPEDVEGVVAGLSASDRPMDREVAAIVRERAPDQGPSTGTRTEMAPRRSPAS